MTPEGYTIASWVIGVFVMAQLANFIDRRRTSKIQSESS